MSNNINDIQANNNPQSILQKKIYLKYHQKTEASKKDEIQFIKLLIQSYIDKNIANSILLSHTWLCIKIIFNIVIEDENKKENENKQDDDDKTDISKDSTEKAIQLFTIPEYITEGIVSFLKQYDKYIEVVNENKDEYLIDLTSYIINNPDENLDEEKKMNEFLLKLKIIIEQKFNITIFMGKGNNILLASLACLKCFIESTKNKNNESIILNDINELFEDNDRSDYLYSVKNDSKSILSFMNRFPLEYLEMGYNKYFENFINKKINKKNFPNILNLGDIINICYEDVYNIYNKDNAYKDIFLFCLGVGGIFHKKQIIINNEQNINNIAEKSFKNKNKSQIINIYIKLGEDIFKQIYYYQYNPKTLVIILKDNKNKIYKRVTDKDSLFDNKDSILNIGIKIINQICNNMNEDEIKSFIYMKIYFDNIVKLDTIDRKIWEEAYNDEIIEVRLKNNKMQYWKNFLNSKSKDDSKNKSKSKSIDNSINNNNLNSKLKMMNKKNSFTSKSINDVNKYSKKVN